MTTTDSGRFTLNGTGNRNHSFKYYHPYRHSTILPPPLPSLSAMSLKARALGWSKAIVRGSGAIYWANSHIRPTSTKDPPYSLSTLRLPRFTSISIVVPSPILLSLLGVGYRRILRMWRKD
ncbi:hypothetical protein BT96DRAFT_1000974 [Gymnopus androsaceus JB14]|uniref:Uncharacterized protein n=1 Tax=Gymnopus androsaceus JB14 TaxID=1447944 RepID=A0A6A4H339_9AGAR|nr:hypothetical protein BT96DRAFT_1000974 [Gymnopus androsaceus JB14]